METPNYAAIMLLLPLVLSFFSTKCPALLNYRFAEPKCQNANRLVLRLSEKAKRVESLQGNLERPSDLIKFYALIERIRLMSKARVLAAAAKLRKKLFFYHPATCFQD
jgi:hypothetical protein